jgi:hypothetical protein
MIHLLTKLDRMWYSSSMNMNYRSLNDIASEIRKDWGVKVNFAAKPYLEAMQCLTTMQDKYICDSALSIVSYFLCNASAWKGETAKRIKAELKAMCAGKAVK